MNVNCTLVELRANSLRNEMLGKICKTWYDYFANLQCLNFEKPSVCESECTYTIISTECDYSVSQVQEEIQACDNFTITVL